MSLLARAALSLEARAIPTVRRAHALVMAFFSVLYVLTLHPGVGGTINMGDSAKFQFLGTVHGLGHPPGNPLYLLADAAICALPLPATAAYKVNLLSALFGVATLSASFRLMSLVSARAGDPRTAWPLGPIRTPVIGTLLLGLGPLFWTLSTEAEVYTLSTFFSSLALLGFARWVLLREERALGLGLFAWLMGFGNHLSIVSLTPAVFFLLWTTRRNIRHPGRTFLIATAGALIGAGSYGYIYLRARGALAYSEFNQPLTLDSFFEFITAKPYRKEIGNFGLSSAVHTRLPVVLSQLQGQWLWPLLFVLPFGIARLYRASGSLFRFLGVAILGQVAFGFLYPIPDPEGFFMPLLPLIALLLVSGLSTLYEGKQRVLLLGLSAVAVLSFAGIHIADFWNVTEPDLVMGTRDGAQAILYPTLFDDMPDRSMFAVPCGHYGCVEVTNYFRLADETVSRKHITFVKLAWSEWDDNLGTLPVISPIAARVRTVCTVMPGDFKKLEEFGVALKPLHRAPYHRHNKDYIPSEVMCTGVGSAPRVKTP